MRLVQKLSLLLFVLLLVPACRTDPDLGSPGEPGLIVDEPRVSMTVFTNWQVIEVTYTLHWLDGYSPRFDLVEPEVMSFSPFELDPIRGHKQVKLNERKYKQENYVDLVYYLRHVGETKGEMPIPEQIFKYTKDVAGQSSEGQELREHKVPPLPLRYDSVLTKDANDIMDPIDFGSFKEQSQFWLKLIVVPAVLFCAILFLLFRKPTVSRKTKKALKAKMLHVVGAPVDDGEVRLEPAAALKHLDEQLAKFYNQIKDQDSEEFSLVRTQVRGMVCNEMRQFFFCYIPDLLPGEFPVEEIQGKILQLPNKKSQEVLHFLTILLADHEHLLGKQQDRTGLASEIDAMRMHLGDLKSWRIRTGKWVGKTTSDGLNWLKRKILRRSQ